MRRSADTGRPSPTLSGMRRQRGYALIIMVVLLVMGSLYSFVASLNEVTRAKFARSQVAGNSLALAKETLLGSYAATYRDTHSTKVFGYLPCPDTDGDGDYDVYDNCGTAGTTIVGLLPYKSLGLPDLRDTSTTCLWYVVSGAFKNSPVTEPMNWDTQGQIAILDTEGNVLATPDDNNGGVAAVIIAAGAPLSGQSRTAISEPCGVMPSEISAYLDGNYSFPSSGTLQLTQGTAGSDSNNDVFLYITPKEIFSRIVARTDFKNTLAAGGHINTLSDQIKAVVEKGMQADMLATGAPTGDDKPDNQSGYSQFSGKLVGDLPDMDMNTGSYDAYFENWKDQYRLVTCSSLTSVCLNIANTWCRGALLFGGQKSTGGPRPSTEKPPATLPAPPNTYLANYFETGSGLEILNSSSTTFPSTGKTSYSDPSNLASARASDVATCLFPGSFVSFTKNIGSFTKTTTSAIFPEAAIDTSAKTVTLGNPSATTSGSGCVWYPNPLSFSTLLRAYFKFRISNLGEGFMFALADAVRNSSGPACGDTAGSRMGYNGNTYPKFGLEIDSRLSSARQDPDESTSSQDEHYAFVFWGTTSTINDDNTHNAGTTGSTTQPLNPTSSKVASASWSSGTVTVQTTSDDGWVTGQSVVVAGITPTAYNGSYTITKVDSTHFTYPLASDPGAYSSGGTMSSGTKQGLKILTGTDSFLPASTSWATNTDYHVRLDIAKSYTSPSGTYTLRAYVASSFPSCSITDFQDLSRDLSDICTSTTYPVPYIEQNGIVIDNISGYGEAMARVYAGFTNAQSSSGSSEQTVVISDFMIRSQ